MAKEHFDKLGFKDLEKPEEENKAKLWQSIIRAVTQTMCLRGVHIVSKLLGCAPKHAPFKK